MDQSSSNQNTEDKSMDLSIKIEPPASFSDKTLQTDIINFEADHATDSPPPKPSIKFYEIDQSRVNENPQAPPIDVAVPIPKSEFFLTPQAIERKESLAEFEYEDKYDGPCPKLGPYQFKDSGHIYVGQWKNGKRHGRGILYWPEGSIYEGRWASDKAEGKGRIIYADGDCYEGSWAKDLMHGSGVYRFSEGGQYKGSFINGEFSGHGTRTYTDGGKYVGHFEGGLRQGTGTLYFPDGMIFIGDFREDEIHGKGELIYPDGRKYEGSFKEGRKHGKGSYTYLDGRKYTGRFVDDEPEGYGTCDWPDGSRYEGEWYRGKQHGKGRFRDNLGIWHKDDIYVEGKTEAERLALKAELSWKKPEYCMDRPQPYSELKKSMELKRSMELRNSIELRKSMEPGSLFEFKDPVDLKSSSVLKDSLPTVESIGQIPEVEEFKVDQEIPELKFEDSESAFDPSRAKEDLIEALLQENTESQTTEQVEVIDIFEEIGKVQWKDERIYCVHLINNAEQEAHETLNKKGEIVETAHKMQEPQMEEKNQAVAQAPEIGRNEAQETPSRRRMDLPENRLKNKGSSSERQTQAGIQHYKNSFIKNKPLAAASLFGVILSAFLYFNVIQLGK